MPIIDFDHVSFYLGQEVLNPCLYFLYQSFYYLFSDFREVQALVAISALFLSKRQLKNLDKNLHKAA